MDLVLAAVDIGTNSVHMVVARIRPDGRVELLDREKDMVRLGRSGGDMKTLDADAIDRGVAALRRCREVADAHGAEVAAVATSAVREADNRREFIDRAWAEAGVHVDVVSGFEEARLIHLGVLQALPLFDKTVLLVDIGGGSTEVLVGREGEVLASRSFRLGAIRLTERHLQRDPIKDKHVARARRHAEGMMAAFASEVAELGVDAVVGASGTVETVVRMAMSARGDTDSPNGPRSLNAVSVSASEIRSVVATVVEARTPDAIARLPGADPSRADILLAGAIILEQFVDTFEVPAVTFSDYALREGVLLDQARRRTGGTLHHLRDLRRASVLRLMDMTDRQPEHARETARLALELFDGLQSRLGHDDEARELLEAAALLCNVGVFISHSGHHKHSYYVIRNSEHLAGFTERELEIIGQVARYHRKSTPKAKHPEFAALDADDQATVRGLAAVLRVATGLDRSRERRVAAVSVDIPDDPAEAVTILLHPTGPVALDLERHAAATRRELLEDVLGRDVDVRVGEPRAVPESGTGPDAVAG